MLKKIRHIGVVVGEFERALEKFRGFGLPPNEVIDARAVGAKIAFMPIGDAMIELISHTEPDTRQDPLVRVVRGNAGAINHICFEVDDLEATVQDFEKGGARLVQGCPREGAHGRIAFFYPETTEDVLIELCEV